MCANFVYVLNCYICKIWHTNCSGAVAGGAMAPLLLRPVGKLSMLSEIVGKLSMLSEIVKDVDGGWGGGWRFKMLSSGKNFGLSEKFLVCRKNFSVCRKRTALAPPPQKKTWDPRRHCHQCRVSRWISYSPTLRWIIVLAYTTTKQKR
jgi:hypothetical protein